MPQRWKPGEVTLGNAAKRVRFPALMEVVVLGPKGPMGTMLPPRTYTGGLSVTFAYTGILPS
jgi:hypothetical protein